MDGSRLPSVEQDPDTLDLVARYAPILMCDANEPFEVVAVGYTVMSESAHSDSFPRWVELKEYAAARAIEYALWWDWDIQHLYELEHAWSFIDARGNLVAAEASFHGYYVPIGVNAALKTEGTHPLLYVEAGKHAMLSAPLGYEVMREETFRATGAEAGKDGLLVKEMFAGELDKSAAHDGLIEEYLRAHAFAPTFDFATRVELRRAQLLPWSTMRAWIPARCYWWIQQLCRQPLVVSGQ